MEKREKQKEGSEDKSRKNMIKREILVLYSLATVGLSLALWELYNRETINNQFVSRPIYYIVAVVVLVLSIPLFALLIHLKDKEEEFYENYDRYLLKKPEDGSLKEDVINEMIKNNHEIVEYFKITKWQERVSYYISITCAIIGVAILVYSVYAIFTGDNTRATIISVISGSITEVVSGIVLWIHNKSAMQLNYYYDALHENEKFLSAINLAEKLGEEERNNMYIEIIKAQIKAREDNGEV